ncbi:MAG: PP0621 family protein [Sulfurovum sp.]|nr:PP0621 family protein [Sulfurovum sp.]
MILKLIIFAIVGLLIYKFFGGKFPKMGRTADEKQLEDNTLVECAKCSTYVTVKESMLMNGEYYCSSKCREK